MMKRLFQFSVAFAALLPMASAMAADYETLPPPPPPPPPMIMQPPPPPPPPPVDRLRPASYDWTGGYIGAFVSGICADGIIHDIPTNANFNNAGCGYGGGALGGYEFQMDPVVLGLEGNLETTSWLSNYPTTQGDFKYGYDYLARLNARVGWAMDSTMLFATIGGAYAQGHLDDNLTTTNTNMTGGHWGWTLGGGIEHAVTDQFRVRAEYLFTKFYDASYTCPTCNLTANGNLHEFRLAGIFAF